MKKTQTGTELIAAERRRQIEQKGFTEAHDRGHIEAQLAWGAICYAYPQKRLIKKAENSTPVDMPVVHLEDGPEGKGDYIVLPPSMWPWKPGDWKPGAYGTLSGRIRELTKAGAMIAAEIDRLQNLLQTKSDEL